MKEIFEQYGGAIVTVIAVVALAALIKIVLGTGAEGPVYQAFSKVISELSTKATAVIW